MPKKAVPLATGEMYHVYNRGVDKRTIFNDKSDYLRFYQSLYYFNTFEPTINFQRAARKEVRNIDRLIDVQAYCLLPNHYHLIVKQLQNGGLSSFMKRISAGYTGYFNEKYDHSGVLFQGKYKKVHVANQEQYNYVFAYVNENYVVHGGVRPDKVCYSSSLVHQGAMRSKLIFNPSDEYNLVEAQKLAIQINEMRSSLTLER